MKKTAKSEQVPNDHLRYYRSNPMYSTPGMAVNTVFGLSLFKAYNDSKVGITIIPVLNFLNFPQ